MIQETYLPFSEEDLRRHYTADADGHIRRLRASAERYAAFLEKYPDREGISLSRSKRPRQVEKDETFWTATSLKSLFDAPDRVRLLGSLLSRTFGEVPPLPDFPSWEECLDGRLQLFFEAQLPSPASYSEWLRDNLEKRHIIPYVHDAAARSSARPLEGATHVDALLINSENGFNILVEAKVLSDISVDVSFDAFRNQLARNIDVMLEAQDHLGSPVGDRDPERALFALMTPRVFRENPASRLYGHLLREYQTEPRRIGHDLPHRQGFEWSAVANRIGWICFEDVEEELPGACPWLSPDALTS